MDPLSEGDTIVIYNSVIPNWRQTNDYYRETTKLGNRYRKKSIKDRSNKFLQDNR